MRAIRQTAMIIPFGSRLQNRNAGVEFLQPATAICKTGAGYELKEARIKPTWQSALLKRENEVGEKYSVPKTPYWPESKLNPRRSA